MKNKTDKRSYTGFWIILVAAIVLEATSCIQYVYSRKTIRAEAEQRAKSELRRAELEINVVTAQMESAVKMLAMMAERYVDAPDSMFAATRALVGCLDNVNSAGIAFKPDYFPQCGHWFEVCSSREMVDGKVEIYTRQIGGANHDYFQTEWFHNGMTIDSCKWSEPYFDDSGARQMVVSCSYPIRNADGEVVAVALVDLSLEYLKDISEYLQVYADSYFSITSGSGLDIVPSPDTVAGRKYHIFNEEIDATGWHISIIIPDEVIYEDLKRIGLIVFALMIIGLGLLVFIVYRSGRDTVRLVKSTAQNERMESELNVARTVQMSLLPKFQNENKQNPPLPCDIYGLVIPAKEVGGDLYDFYVKEDTLFFCVGDVSGKGVPSSIVMATTRSLFRAISAHEQDIATIVGLMNDAMSDTNDQNMFVTFFLGILNMKTGVLNYCNAGHNTPVLVKNGDLLPIIPNLPLGVLSGFSYTPQTTTLHSGDTLFLYTDGLSEAENRDKALYGENRMLEEIARIENAVGADERTAKYLVDAMLESVTQFVDGAEQSDDLTMLAIHYLPSSDNETDGGKSMRHSIVMRNDIQQIPTLAEWIENLHVPSALSMTINLALEEAVTNVMLYAYPQDKNGQVQIEAEKTDNQITFVISDSGIPFDPTKQPPVNTSLGVEERSIGGLGIHLVRQIMDHIQYRRENKKNILTLVKKYK